MQTDIKEFLKLQAEGTIDLSLFRAHCALNFDYDCTVITSLTICTMDPLPFTHANGVTVKKRKKKKREEWKPLSLLSCSNELLLDG